MKQQVEKIFNDLDSFRDFCRYEGFVFNEADLYKKASYVWRAYLNRHKPRPKNHKDTRNKKNFRNK